MCLLAEKRGWIFSFDFQNFMMILSSILLKIHYETLYYKCMLNLSQGSEVLLVKVAFFLTLLAIWKFSQEALHSFGEFGITSYRKVEIEFCLLRLKLD